MTDSTRALKRLVKSGQLHKPGVKLDIPPHVPLFRADPDEAGIVIRIWNGKTERGTFTKQGKFKVKK